MLLAIIGWFVLLLFTCWCGLIACASLYFEDKPASVFFTIACAMLTYLIYKVCPFSIVVT